MPQQLSILAPLLLTLSVLSGCGGHTDSEGTPQHSNEPPSSAKQTSDGPDAAFAISYANNWLVNPSLDEAAKVKRLLKDAEPVHPEEIRTVLAQVQERESALKAEKLFDQAERDLQEGRFDAATRAFREYSRKAPAERSDEAEAYVALIEHFRSPEKAKEHLMSLPRDVLEELQADPDRWHRWALEQENPSTVPDRLLQEWLTLCKSQLPHALKALAQQQRAEMLSLRRKWYQRILDSYPEVADVDPSSEAGIAMNQLYGGIKTRTAFQHFFDTGKLYLRDVLIFATKPQSQKASNYLREAKQEIPKIVEKVFTTPGTANAMTTFSANDTSGFNDFGVSGVRMVVSDSFVELTPFGLAGWAEGSAELFDKYFAELLEDQDDLHALCLVDQKQRAFQLLTLYRRFPFGLRSVVTGFWGDNPRELLDIEYDFKRREEKYSQLAQEYICRDYLSVRVKIPDVSGSLYEEGRIDLRANTSSGNVEVMTPHVSSRDELLADIFAKVDRSGTFDLTWQGTSDAGQHNGSVTARIKKLSLKSVLLLGEGGVASVTRWGNSETVSSEIAKFKARTGDAYLVLKCTFPSKVHGFVEAISQGQMEGSTGFRSVTDVDISTNGTEWKNLYRRMSDNYWVVNEELNSELVQNGVDECFLRFKVPAAGELQRLIRIEMWMEE